MIKQLLAMSLFAQILLPQNSQIADNNILSKVTKLKPLQSIIISYLSFEETDDDIDWPTAGAKEKMSPHISLTHVETGKKFMLNPDLQQGAHGYDFTSKSFSLDSRYLAGCYHSTKNLDEMAEVLSEEGMIDLSYRLMIGDVNALNEMSQTNIYLWETENGKKIKVIKIDGVILSIIFLPSEKRLMCACGPTGIHIFDLSDIKKEILINKLDHENARFVILSPNNLYFATYSFDDIKIWNAKTFELMQTLKSSFRLDTASFCPNGLYIGGRQASENGHSFVSHTWKNQALEIALACQKENQNSVNSVSLQSDKIVKKNYNKEFAVTVFVIWCSMILIKQLGNFAIQNIIGNK